MTSSSASVLQHGKGAMMLRAKSIEIVCHFIVRKRCLYIFRSEIVNMCICNVNIVTLRRHYIIHIKVPRAQSFVQYEGTIQGNMKTRYTALPVLMEY